MIAEVTATTPYNDSPGLIASAADSTVVASRQVVALNWHGRDHPAVWLALITSDVSRCSISCISSSCTVVRRRVRGYFDLRNGALRTAAHALRPIS